MRARSLPLLAGENISARFVVPTVAGCVDLVVQVGLGAQGRRRVREIVGVPGRVEADVIETEPIFSEEHGRLVRGRGMSPRLDRFGVCGIDIHALLSSGASTVTAAAAPAEAARR